MTVRVRIQGASLDREGKGGLSGSASSGLNLMGEKEEAMERPGERHSWERDHQSPKPSDGKDIRAKRPLNQKEGHHFSSSMEEQGLYEVEDDGGVGQGGDRGRQVWTDCRSS